MKLLMNPRWVLLTVQILVSDCRTEPELNMRLVWAVAYPILLAVWLWFLKILLALPVGRYPAFTLSRPMKKLPDSMFPCRASMLRLDLLHAVLSVCRFFSRIATLGVARPSRPVPLISNRLVPSARFPDKQPWNLLVVGLNIVNDLVLATLGAVLA